MECFSPFLPQVGRKSLNLALLRRDLPQGLAVPTCITLPFGTFERALEANPEAKKQVSQSGRRKDAGEMLLIFHILILHP